MSINNKLFPVAFAENAGSTWKYSIPQALSDTDPANKASYEVGFPALTMTEIAAGGIPFFGQDVNGVLNEITTAIRYIQSGNYQTYDSEFATSIGGYDKGSVILGSDGKLYQSTVDANKTNPIGGSGWTGFMEGKYLPLSGGTLTGALTGTDITAKTSLTVGSAKATYSTTGLNFDKALFINGTAVLKKGEYGFGGSGKYYEYAESDLLNLFKSSVSQIFNNGIETKYTGIYGPNLLLSVANIFANLNIPYTGDAPILTVGNLSGTTLNTYKLITTANIGSYQSGLGINQTWQLVSREAGVEYTNTTGRSIVISLFLKANNPILYIDGVNVMNGNINADFSYSTIIPAGSKYKITQAVTRCAELR